MAGFEMVVSDFSQTVSRNGTDIQVLIYRLEHERDWSVEIAESEGLPTFWDTAFFSERVALQAALRAANAA